MNIIGVSKGIKVLCVRTKIERKTSMPNDILWHKRERKRKRVPFTHNFAFLMFSHMKGNARRGPLLRSTGCVPSYLSVLLTLL